MMNLPASEHKGPLELPLKEILERKESETERLLAEAKRRLPQLKALLAEVSSHWGYEDGIYRFYHQSFKVYYGLQPQTVRIVAELQALAPHLKLNPYFLQIVADGTGKEFNEASNRNWLQQTRPIVEAFFHARHILEMMCKYAEELNGPPQMLPSGWATVLEIYQLR
jgi:hypothetical protein